VVECGTLCSPGVLPTFRGSAARPGALFTQTRAPRVRARERCDERRDEKRMASPSSQSACIQTPCIKVCVVDAGSGLCCGCARSLDEIARWAAMTERERRSIMRELPLRRAQVRGVAAGAER